MARQVVEDEAAARADLGDNRCQPAWLTGRHALPFQDLSDDEFEVFSYLLLLREHPGERIVYYGKTGDAGRDIVWTHSDGTVEVIQCKRYDSNVGIGEVRGELAKLCTNIFRRLIPVSPDKVTFYAVPDLTAPAKDLLFGTGRWAAACKEALREHLREEPANDLVVFAETWHPEFWHEDEIKLTERARAYPELIDEFFLIRQVVSGSLGELAPRFDALDEKVAAVHARLEGFALQSQPAPQPLLQARGMSDRDDTLRCRALVARVNLLEERDRTSLDADGQCLVSEVQTAVRSLNLREAAAAFEKVEKWLAKDGQHASRIVRCRIALLLADLALISELEFRGEVFDTTPARRWYGVATSELPADARAEDLARVAALEVKLLGIEGKCEEALELAASAAGDPACLATRLALLIDQKDFDAVLQAVSGLATHERWCDRLALAHAALGDTLKAQDVVELAETSFERQTCRRCRLAVAQGHLHWVRATWSEARTIAPSQPPDFIRERLQTALAALAPLVAEAEAGGPIVDGLTAEAMACASFCARLMGDRPRAASLATLLGSREPVHLEHVRAMLRGDIDFDKDLPERVRSDYPRHFDARFLGVALRAMASEGDAAAFAEAIEVAGLATSSAQKEDAIGAALELAAGVPGAFDEVERVAGQMLESEHRLLLFARAANQLSSERWDAAAPILSVLQDEADPLWRQFTAALCTLRGDKIGAFEHLQAASYKHTRPEVLEQAARAATLVKRHDAVEEILRRLVQLRPRDVDAWERLAHARARLGRHGQTAEAFGVLCQLEPEDCTHHTNYAKALALAGRRDEALSAYNKACSHPPHSLDAFGGRAHLLGVLGRPKDAFATLAQVRDEFWSDPEFLLLYMDLGYRAGSEDEARVAMERLLELQQQGQDVPIWSYSLEELIAEFRARRRAHEALNLGILRGHLPWLAVGRFVGRPALWDWAFRTQDLAAPPVSPQQHAEASIYSTNGWTVRPDDLGHLVLQRVVACPPPGTEVVADLSSLLTLFQLGLLGHAVAYFGKIMLPASYSELALAEPLEYQPHQISRLDAARAIIDAVERGKLFVAGTGPTAPLLDEFSDKPAYRLGHLATWLHENGHITQTRLDELAAQLQGHPAEPSLPPVQEVVHRGFLTSATTLEAALRVGLLRDLVSAMRLSLPASDIEEMRSTIWQWQHQERISGEHHALWRMVHEDGRFDQAEVERESEREGEDGDRRILAVFDAARLSEARKLPLLVDDRACQAVVLNARRDEGCAAFGTDCLLVALAESGAITDDDLAEAFLKLIRWRYRFLVPPVRAIITLAARHRQYPPGGPLREVSRYVHDCFSDPGLLTGYERTAPPVSVAWVHFRNWVQQVARFVVAVHRDERFDNQAADALTDWAVGELLPSPPASLPRAGAYVLCETTAHQFFGSLYDAPYANRGAAASVIASACKAFGLAPAEYLAIAGDCLDALSIQMPADDSTNEYSAARRRVATIALSTFSVIGARAYFALLRLGLVNAPAAEEFPDEEIDVIRDQGHPLRLPGPPGPAVFFRVPGEEDAGEARFVPDYLLSPVLTARQAALANLERAGQEAAGWLCPRSRAAIAETAKAIRSDVLSEWLPAASQLFGVLEDDFLLNLAAFCQYWIAEMHSEQRLFWRRVIRPGLNLRASVPLEWYGHPTNVFQSTAHNGELGDALDRFFSRSGHLPSAPASDVVRSWLNSGDANKAPSDVLAQLWAWAGDSPFRTYHACRICLSIPELVSPNAHEELWCRVRPILAPAPVGEESSTPTSIGWELRVALARQYLGQLLLHASEQQSSEQLACLAWWTAERVAHAITASLESAGATVVDALGGVLSRMVVTEVELTEVEYDILRPSKLESPLAIGTMESRNIWALALAIDLQRAPAVHPSEETQALALATLFGAMLSGFPPPGQSAESDAAQFDGFDHAVTALAEQMEVGEVRSTILDGVSRRCEGTTSGGILQLLRAAPSAEPHWQYLAATSFRSVARMRAIEFDAAWALVSDSEWLRSAAQLLETKPLEALTWGLMEIQRRGDDRWRWGLPEVLCALSEELDVPAERRRVLALAAVRSAAMSANMAPVRRLLFGRRQEELWPLIDEWRDQFGVLRRCAPPIAAAHLRAIVAGLSR